MTNWKEYKLSDLMQIEYGKDHKLLVDESFPLYNQGDVKLNLKKVGIEL